MDPNANLQEQERLLTTIAARVRTVGGIRFGGSADTSRLLDLRQALYDWIRDGGFEPDWSVAPNARQYYGR